MGKLLNCLKDIACPIVFLGTLGAVVGTEIGKNLERKKLITQVEQRADKDNDSRLSAEEIGNIYQRLNKPFYYQLTEKDMREYLILTED